ncbi:MAG: DNA primase [Candidatus Paceibacterota bacterium]
MANGQGNDAVGEIKERLSIADVVAPHVKLHRAGKSLTGLCPFHKEKTPSFHVSAERGTYHCFGCGEGGDIFSFVEKVDGVDFRTALKMLAEKAGVKLETRQGGGEDTSRKERLRDAMQKAGQWYAGKLAGTPAEAYAKKRGLTAETIQRWSVGYAPNGWRGLLEEFAAHGFTTDELLGAGLIKEADGKAGTYYDRFRDRLMFPINDVAGRTVAFTGRALSADEPAKYLNSPETALYHKSDVLFGMDKAKDAIRVRGFAILVEGQMDAVLAHQAGFENVIALSGTALTERHVALLKRYSENLMLVLDADTAGLSATAKSAQLALREGLRVKAVRLPLGKDPADIISEDAQDFATRVKSAKPVVEFFLSVLAEKESDPHRLLRTAEAVVLPLISVMQSPMEREHFIQSTARALSLSTEAVRESLGRMPAQAATTDAGVAFVPNVPARSSIEVRGEQLLGALRAYAGTPLASRIETEYSRITGAATPAVEALPEHAVFEAEKAFGEQPAERAADELLHAFEKAVIREAYQEAVTRLRRAESSGDSSAIRSAQELCTTLAARLAPFGN